MSRETVRHKPTREQLRRRLRQDNSRRHRLRFADPVHRHQPGPVLGGGRPPFCTARQSFLAALHGAGFTDRLLSPRRETIAGLGLRHHESGRPGDRASGGTHRKRLLKRRQAPREKSRALSTTLCRVPGNLGLSSGIDRQSTSVGPQKASFGGTRSGFCRIPAASMRTTSFRHSSGCSVTFVCKQIRPPDVWADLTERAVLVSVSPFRARKPNFAAASVVDSVRSNSRSARSTRRRGQRSGPECPSSR